MGEFIATKIEDIHWSSGAPLGELALWAIPPIKALCFALDTAVDEDDLDTRPVLINAIVAQLDALDEALRRLEKEHMKAEREKETEPLEEKTMKELELDVATVATLLKGCVKSFEAMEPRLAILEKGKPELKEAA